MILQIDAKLAEKEYVRYADDMIVLAQAQQKVIDEALIALAKQKLTS